MGWLIPWCYTDCAETNRTPRIGRSEAEPDQVWLRLRIGQSEVELGRALRMDLEQRLAAADDVADAVQEADTGFRIRRELRPAWRRAPSREQWISRMRPSATPRRLPRSSAPGAIGRASLGIDDALEGAFTAAPESSFFCAAR